MTEKRKARPQKSRQQSDGIPTASYVGDDQTLVELVYRPEEQRTAFAVWRDDSWSIEPQVESTNGDQLIPFSPDNNLIRHEAVLFPSEPMEYGSQEDLLSAIARFIHSYVDVSPLFEKIASYYVLLSWIHDAFNELPYLRLRGEYGTGKTRALLCIGSLCYKPFFASGASTVSPIFHTLDAFGCTLLLDEADFRFSDEKAQVVKILNNGNVRGLPVLRTIVNRQREFNPRAFQVFGPKIVATRGSYDDPALESRFITEDMGQRPLREDIPINLPASYKDEARELRNRLLLYRFRNRHSARIDDTLVDARIEPRLNQILVPLLSVIDDPGVQEDLRAVAAAYQAATVAERGQSLEGQVLEVLHELCSETDRGAVPVGDIAARLAERCGDDYERPITNRWVGSVLRRRLRLATYKSHGVYVVPMTERSKLDVLWRKYGVVPKDTKSTKMTHQGDMGTSGTSEPA